MYEVKFVPKNKTMQVIADDKFVFDEQGQPVFEEKGPDYSGTIRCKVPKNVERMELLNEMAFEVDEKGNLNVSDKKTVTRVNTLWIEFALKHIISVDLTRTSDEFKVPNVEFLEFDAQGAAVLIQCGQFLAKGVTLGNA